ncbi:hypothetical protein FZC78_02205 [Rossellomorea vietnamensis]|uniref:Uncharacterized protein n=1 Tax=Rossellomorea vietnamensis TaxID=218284 RepID=A0A5D4P1H4_9BACI|nr:hypothetical protein [Rossellomorea vietnamensis]TYS19861.1 hypothetical protein FZC78_02205 [Rossellomorea vietnamensis]
MTNRVREEMDKIKVPDELETRFQLGVREAKIERNPKMKGNRLFSRLNKVTRVAVVALGIVLTAGIYTYATDHQLIYFLNSSNGEKVIEFDKDDINHNTSNSGYVKNFEELVKEHYTKKLEPGEVAAFYSVKEVKQSTAETPPQLYYVDAPYIYTDFSQYKEAIEHSYLPDKELPNHYSFAKGVIRNWYEPFSAYEKAKLLAKAKNSEEEIVEEIFKTQEEQLSVSTSYSNGTSEIVVNSFLMKMQIDEYRFSNDTTLESVMIHDLEALYIREEETDIPIQEVKWMVDKDGKTMMYTVSSQDLVNVTKDDLITISEVVYSHNKPD